MRKTHFVGLNKKADEFVKQLTPIPSDNYAYGIYSEKIPLGKWQDNFGNVYCEFVQTEIWSSLPMIFTALRFENTNEEIHLWLGSRELTSEFDYINGIYAL